MKQILGWLLAALLAPGTAMGMQDSTPAPEVLAPGFAYHSLGTEAGKLIRLESSGTQVAGELFLLEDGYLSIAYEREDNVISFHPAGKPITFLNRDLCTRWVLEDERLTGAWYTDLLELPDALLLGWERTPGTEGQVYSLLMLDKDTGAIRWQREGPPIRDAAMVWIGICRGDAGGDILVGSSGDLRRDEPGQGTLSLLSAGDGSVLWAVEYQSDYGMTAIWDLCPLGEGWLIYGVRENDRIVLWANALGAAQGYFTFQPWSEGHDYTWLSLLPVSEDAVYLAGWEMEVRLGEVDEPFQQRTLNMMRITAETFGPENYK